jgi:hypothetical protein
LRGENFWTQYFEQPVGIEPQDVARMLADPDEPIGPENIVRIESRAAIDLSETDPDSIYTWFYRNLRENPPTDLSAWFAEQRRKGRETVKKYLKIKPQIQAKADEFYRRNLEGRYVLGIHMRGTDLHYAPPVSPPEYYPVIDEEIAIHPDLKIFLATDQVQYLDAVKQRYGERVASYECMRSDDERAIFKRPEGSPYDKGEELVALLPAASIAQSPGSKSSQVCAS